MGKINLETRARKAVLNIEKKIGDIYNSLNDMNLKLYHIIKSQSSYEEIYHDILHGRAYYE